MANMDVLEQAMTYIKDHPEEHDQSTWICGTAACLAGRVVLQQIESPQITHGQFVANAPGWADDEAPIPQVSNRLIGISRPEGEILYCETNTVETLELMVKDLGNGDRLTDRWRRELMRRPDGEVSGYFEAVRRIEDGDA